MRTGLIARKVGMTRHFRDDGTHVPVTVLQVEGCRVVAHRTAETDGYTALQVGAGKPNAKRLTKAVRGHFAKSKVEPTRHLAEFRVPADDLVPVGHALTVEQFVPGQFVDVAGVTIGKGFAGVLKRHNFRGLRATHGVSISHRSHGSTGQRQDPGKVFKNKKMAGHMGATQVTAQSLEVIAVDGAQGLLLIKGTVPGAKGNVVTVRDAVKRALPKDLPKPGVAPAAPAAAAGQE